MSVALLFDLLIVLSIISWALGAFGGERWGWFAPYNGGLVLLLIFLLGLGVYGWPVKG